MMVTRASDITALVKSMRIGRGAEKSTNIIMADLHSNPQSQKTYIYTKWTLCNLFTRFLDNISCRAAGM